jgi:hypothetical protein
MRIPVKKVAGVDDVHASDGVIPIGGWEWAPPSTGWRQPYWKPIPFDRIGSVTQLRAA